ncbi:hypothetical protein LCGC14_0092000 [marine sediment metagenome]|uniref:Uncharacterized protein n=1 Tax=marine sediment metagenome TaxID=412755 RepID=A0A0F9VV26_9ZZZZ|nr:DNA-protecting protein DprA [Halopseudomonas sabulinigri]
MFPDLSDTRQAWLALMLIDGVGPRFIQRLLQEFDSPQAFLTTEPGKLRAMGVVPRVLNSLALLHRNDSALLARLALALEWQTQPGQQIICLDEPSYPAQLRQIADPPVVLFVRGNSSLLVDPQIAMVGTRHPSALGAETARAFANSFSRSGLTVTSGMALGIDAACHQGALDANGQTLAVWGTGLDRCYPARHRKLAEQIVAQGGTLVSEMWPDMGPQPGQFPRRNRIISGLSLGTLVVEASLNSGSLITARLALEQDREVFAMPGSIHNVQARGCHRLLREGACLVESVQDVFDVLKLPLQAALQVDNRDVPEPDSPLWRWLGFEPVSPDWLAQRSGLLVQEVMQGLLELELDGQVLNTAQGFCRARP